MRKIRTKFELSEKGISVDRRYVIVVGDGVHGERFVLGPKDQFSRPEWEFLVGPSNLSATWHSDTDEGMYVTFARQYVNPNFDFEPDSYRRGDFLLDLPDVQEFRLSNPLFARPGLSWPNKGRTGWIWADSYSEGDEHQYSWSYENWELKLSETDVRYTVKRLNDSDDYKEFLVRLD